MAQRIIIKIIFSFFICAGFWGFSFPVFGQELSETSSAQIARLIRLVSPSKEPFIAEFYPKKSAEFSVDYFPYPYEKWGLKDFDFKNYTHTKSQNVHRENYLKEVKSRLAQNPQNSGLRYLEADLIFLEAWQTKKPEKLTKAYSQLKKAQSSKQKQSPFFHSEYKRILILIELDLLSDATQLGHQMEGMTNDQPQWARKFRSLVIESYYRKGRYIRAEDYLWQLASKMQKDDLTNHIARRYGDSLFWQGKFYETVEWFENPNVAPLLEPSTPSNQISRLYFAEALYQSGRYQEAFEEFSLFQQQADPQKKVAPVIYRLVQLNLLLSQDVQKAIPEFYSLSQDEGLGDFKALAQINWARLIAKTGDTVLLTSAHTILDALTKTRLDYDVLIEALYVRGLLEWRMQKRVSSIKTLSAILPEVVDERNIHPLAQAASDMAVILLIDEAPLYWKNHDTIGFLVLADRLKKAIQISKYKVKILFWVARAYLENGMIESATRLYEKMLFDVRKGPKNRLALELARVYGMMGEIDLMSMALELIDGVPSKPNERKLYYLTLATYDLLTQNYTRCVDRFDSLLESGVLANELFEFSYQGLICARKDKNQTASLRFLKFLGIDKTQKEEALKELNEIQKKALFEKINVLLLKDKKEEATQLFEYAFNHFEVPPSLETVFNMINLYRETNEGQKALMIWKKYAKNNQSNLPKGFYEQYLSLLELLSEVELLPELEKEAVL